MRFLFTTLAGLGHFHPLVPVAAALRAAGHHVRVATAESFGPRVEASGFPVFAAGFCTGTVRDAADAADATEALLAAVAGAGLVVHAQAPRDIIDRLVDDLRRLGPVEHVVSADPVPAPILTSEEQRLLDALANGKT